MHIMRDVAESAIANYQRLFVDERSSYAHRTIGASLVSDGFLGRYDDSFLNKLDATVDLALLSFATDNAHEIADNIDTAMILEQSLAQGHMVASEHVSQLQIFKFAQRIQESLDSIAQEEFLRRLAILSDPEKIQELKERELRQLHIIASCMSNPVLGVAVALMYALELDKIEQQTTRIQNDDNKTRSLLAVLFGYDLSPIDEEWQQRKESEAKKMAEFFQERLDRYRVEQAQYAQQGEEEAKKQKDADRLAQKDWEERNTPRLDSRQRPRI